jgi:hypothetical protein
MNFLLRSTCVLFLSLALNNAVDPAVPGTDRLRVFISDTHFGVGKVDGRWHNFEDARWAPEFAAFLAAMDRVGNGKTDLILNGDTFELWQSLDPDDCTVASNKDLGCSEQEALHRLDRVLQFHMPELTALASFAKSGDNTVTIVPGNHDAALLFPKVSKRVLDAMNAPANRVRISDTGDWVSPDGLIYSEHGQQIGKEVNKFDHWPRPFLDYKGMKYLQRPWGEQFVQRFYNAYENKYPIIDNISDESIGVRYGLKAEGAAAVPKDSGKFIWFYLTQISWSQLDANFGGSAEHPKWDIPEIRRKGIEFLADSLPKDDALGVAAKQQIAQGTFGLSLDDLGDEDIIELCNLRKTLITADTIAGRPASVQACPLADFGAITQALFSSRNKVFGKYLEEVRQRLSAEHRSERPFLLFVYSHTHKADFGFYPVSESSWNPFVVNTGAWQRTVTPEQLAKIQQLHNLTDANVLTLQPEDLPACYPVVLVEPYKDVPKSKLRFWVNASGSWSLGESCGVI